jgi:hypothetical protein
MDEMDEKRITFGQFLQARCLKEKRILGEETKW